MSHLSKLQKFILAELLDTDALFVRDLVRRRYGDASPSARAATVRAINRLVDRGLVYRKVNMTGARVGVFLTPPGADVANRLTESQRVTPLTDRDDEPRPKLPWEFDATRA